MDIEWEVIYSQAVDLETGTKLAKGLGPSPHGHIGTALSRV